MQDRPPGASTPPGGPALGAADQIRFFQESAVPSLVLDVRARLVLDANAAAVALLGRPVEELRTMSGRDLLHEPTPEDALRARLLRGDRTRTIRVVDTPRGLRTVEIHMVPTDRDGIVFVQAVDLTDVLDANAALESQTRRLREATDALAAVGSRIAHDLRDPLASITNLAALTRSRDDLAPEMRREVLERLERSARAASQVVADIVLEAGTAADDADASTATADLLDLVGSLFSAQIADAGGELALHAEVAHLPVPITAVRQPLVNLVANALRYRDPARALRVVVSVRAVGDRVVVDVDDNGRGFGEDPEELFAPGVRGAGSEGLPGSGTGLPYARTVIERLGGTLTAASPPPGAPVGARLTIELPTGSPAEAPGGLRFGGRPASGLTTDQLDQLLELAPVPAVVIDLLARAVLRLNPAAVALFGRREDEVLGRPAAELLVRPAEGDELRAALLEGRDGHPVHVDTEVDTPDGARPCRVHLVLLPGTTLALAQVVERITGT